MSFFACVLVLASLVKPGQNVKYLHELHHFSLCISIKYIFYLPHRAQMSQFDCSFFYFQRTDFSRAKLRTWPSKASAHRVTRSMKFYSNTPVTGSSNALFGNANKGVIWNQHRGITFASGCQLSHLCIQILNVKISLAQKALEDTLNRNYTIARSWFKNNNTPIEG